MTKRQHQQGSNTKRVDPVEGHRLWAPIYDQDPNPLLALEDRILGPQLGVLSRKHLLDVGCGTGRWLAVAQQRGALVTGIDLTPQILAQAAKKPNLGGHLALAAAAHLPFPEGGFDVALCTFVLGYLQSRERVLQNLARVVRPWGRIIVSDLHPTAVTHGWRSSFRLGETSYEIERDSYDIDQIDCVASRCGLKKKLLVEAAFGEPERAIFAQAGRAEQFAEVKGLPALFVLIWERSDPQLA